MTSGTLSAVAFQSLSVFITLTGVHVDYATIAGPLGSEAAFQFAQRGIVR